MTAHEIRHSFLDFFEKRGHTLVPSTPVIPQDDPTLLFTNAGMNQFKDVLLGKGKRSYTRAANAQKCIRVSGKHNDLEEVGRDTYHHTFFEMLGNWSFGDYYKKEAIEWAWELLTREWKLDKRRLYATVFEKDDDAYELWRKVTDIDHAHVLRFGKKDNFWEMGETGPCGPCSEIHFDFTPDFGGKSLINTGDPRAMEIWNLVFIQFDRNASGNLSPLPSSHVDTGMGLERMCAVLQGKRSNYDTDVFSPTIQYICKLTSKEYTGRLESLIDIALRVVADHVRMLTFAIADGGIPSNEGRGYVIRRILRRAARFGRALDMHEPFLYRIVAILVDSMRNVYPEIRDKQAHIERIVKSEEESFSAALDRGLEIFEAVVGRLGTSRVFPGEDAFKLYDTFGFPLDLTEMIARERGLTVENSKFDELMEEQRRRSQIASRPELIAGPPVVMWEGQNKLEQRGKDMERFDFDYNKAIVETEIELDNLSFPQGERLVRAVILRDTSFYVESGGQVSDAGSLQLNLSDRTRRPLPVLDVTRYQRRTVHALDMDRNDTLWQDLRSQTASVTTLINIDRRRNIERNHTATHLVHEALRRVFGKHLRQQGSLVAPDRLRFDFNHFDKPTPEELKAIEEIVNEKISEAIVVEAENDSAKWISIEEAKRRHPTVKMFFGDKYGEKVRIVIIDPDFSIELCGGTHVKNTKEIGLFKIISESGIASGIRRIEAVTGEGLQDYITHRLEKIGELDQQLARLIEEQEALEKELSNYTTVTRTQRPSLGSITLPKRDDRQSLQLLESAEKERESVIAKLATQTTHMEKELSRLRVNRAAATIDTLVATATALNGFKVISAKVDVRTMEELKSIADALRTKLVSGVGVLASVVDDKVAFVCVVTEDLIRTRNLQAGKIVGEVAKGVGGTGGGRPHLATAGGKDISKLDETLKRTPGIVETMLQTITDNN